MRNLLFLLTFAFIGCSTANKPLPPEKSAIVKAAIETKRQAVATTTTISDLGVAAETSAVSPTPITSSTKFAGSCPYCQKVSISKTCWPIGGKHNEDGTILESWNITFECPSCRMTFTDSRTQIIPQTQSVRLPIVGN